MQVDEQAERKRRADALYARYAKPLESEHWGEIVAIWPNGELILGSDVLDVMERGMAAFGSGSYIFKVGEKSVWHIR